MKDKVKFAIINHEKIEERTKFFVKLISKKHYKKFVFLFDCEIDRESKQLLESKNIEFYYNKNNIGKLKTILKNIDKINSDYLKIIDADDSIHMKGLVKLTKYMQTFEGKDSVIVHKANKIFSNSSELWGIQTTKKSKIKKQLLESQDVFYKVPPNAKVIYPTKLLKKIAKLELYDQKFFNDDVLTLGCLIINNNNSTKINNEFYIQFSGYGQTRKTNEERLLDYIELVKNLSIISNKYKKTFMQILTKEEIQNIFIKLKSQYKGNKGIIEEIDLKFEKQLKVLYGE